MLNMSGKYRTVNDYDQDFQPCYFEHGSHVDEEFYPVDMVPTPSEDIWKKFELLPTPPRSPRHEPLCGPEVDTLLNLKLVSDKLDYPHQTSHSDDNLQANLIQDCMWSAPGLLAAGIPTDPKTAKLAQVKLSVDTSILKVPSSSLDIHSSDCVDPAAVFPYPLNDSKKYPNLGIETPSESEDTDEDEEDDDDEDDDDEEEIDVVSVSSENQVLSAMIVPARRRESTHHMVASSSMSAQVAAMHNYSSSRDQPPPIKLRVSYSAPQTPSHHNHIPSVTGHKRSRPSSSPGSPQPLSSHSSKRQKLVVSESDLRRVVQKLKLCGNSNSSQARANAHASRTSSDSEDGEGKRAQHNVLERKRRNDLKSNFLRLRDHVPDISTQERAPKVVILRKSADFITSLAHTHRQLEAEREHQKRLQERLKRRIAALNRELL